MQKIRVVLVDDHHLVRRGFQALLSQEPDIEVVGEAADGREAVQLVEQIQPDVLVTDLAMPGMSGLEAIRVLRKRHCPARVLVLTVHSETAYILRALRAGASGYILKSAAASDLASGIRAVHAGEVFLSPPVSTRVVTGLLERLGDDQSTSPLDLLTDREREVLQLIAEGRARRQIAERLCVSPKTVDTHRANLMRKLGVKDDAALVRLAVRHQVVPLDL